ncbi:MAG: LysM peptidoglycan-binding domain-containing protein [Pirellulales bacterium]|nr:LysM peptidoglycan-binding domain-containing protein [Pirellulales bacterium]
MFDQRKKLIWVGGIAIVGLALAFCFQKGPPSGLPAANWSPQPGTTSPTLPISASTPLPQAEPRLTGQIMPHQPGLPDMPGGFAQAPRPLESAPHDPFLGRSPETSAGALFPASASVAQSHPEPSSLAVQPSALIGTPAPLAATTGQPGNTTAETKYDSLRDTVPQFAATPPLANDGWRADDATTGLAAVPGVTSPLSHVQEGAPATGIGGTASASVSSPGGDGSPSTAQTLRPLPLAPVIAAVPPYPAVTSSVENPTATPSAALPVSRIAPPPFEQALPAAGTGAPETTSPYYTPPASGNSVPPRLESYPALVPAGFENLLPTASLRAAPAVMPGDANQDKQPGVRHRVRDGDSLASLAQAYLGDAARAGEIFAANQPQLTNAEVLPLGWELIIPGGPGHNVASSQPGLAALAPPPTLNAVAPANSQLNWPAPLSPPTLPGADSAAGRSITPPQASALGGQGMATFPQSASDRLTVENSASAIPPVPSAYTGWPPAGVGGTAPPPATWANQLGQSSETAVGWLGESLFGPAVRLPAEGERAYLVKPLETWETIAKKFYGDSQLAGRLQQANARRVKDPSRLVPGTLLVIPPK